MIEFMPGPLDTELNPRTGTRFFGIPCIRELVRSVRKPEHTGSDDLKDIGAVNDGVGRFGCVSAFSSED